MTMLTRTSVDWADRIVATASSNGVVKSSSQWRPGNPSASCAANRRARRVRASGVEGIAVGHAATFQTG